MSTYVFIDSRDPFESADASAFLELVAGVREHGSPTTLFLIQNAVLAARRDARPAERFAVLAKQGVTVLADAFSLRERAIDTVADGVKPVEIDALVDLLLTPAVKAVWH